MKSLSRHQLHQRFFLLLLPAIFHSKAVFGMGDEARLAWGVNAVVLKSPWNRLPSMEDLLADQEHTLVLDHFYRDGGQSAPATPTECRIAYTDDAIVVVFRCSEPDMAFPSMPRDPEDWYKLLNSKDYPDTLFPDQVDFLVQPDTASPSYYQFALTPDGMKLGCARIVGPDWAPGAEVHGDKIEAFTATVTKKADEWLAYFQIPWKTVGGKPSGHFGLLPLRTRWRDGQVSSPAAIDFMDEVNSTMKSGFKDAQGVDLFIETHFTGGPVQPMQSSLCKLPSGVLRWQRPALLTYPDLETRQNIWRMESSLSTPTDNNNLGERLYLTQRWTDLLTLEGFTSLPRAWSATIEDLSQYIIRRQINAALRNNDSAKACQLLDAYLGKLDKISRWWYADGSPGDILTQEWTPIDSAKSLEVKGDTLLMHCLAGGRAVELHLVLPKTGGVRIFGDDEGFFKPTELQPLNATVTGGSCSLETADGRIVVDQKPFAISFLDRAGKPVTQIGANQLALRFGSDGKILALDFKNHLEPDEVIYGFGERYDHVNQTGNVVTLWGTDDWIGNGVGLRNTTYKPLPILHSSRGYMFFDNSSYRLRGDIGQTDLKQYRLTQQGPIVDFYFWIGSPEKSLQSYTALTGKPLLPPKWVFEPWMGRGGSAWANGPLHDPVAEEKHTITRFAELDIPHSAIYAEGPSANSPDLHQFVAPRGIRVLSYFQPAIRPARQETAMPELKPDELPLLRCADPKEMTELHGYVDFTNPKAIELCRRLLKHGFDLGVVGSMVDFGDMVPDDAIFHDGTHGDEMHNFYSYAYHQTIGQLYHEKYGDDFILYGRAAAPGTQKFLGQFAGDHSGNFAGLKAVLNGVLNLSACGFSNWGSDLGGYFGTCEPGVFMRWTQFACFSPIWRPHGKTSRDPWFYGDDAVTNYKFHAWVRENILNYTYGTAVTAHETGIPIIRAMPMAFPDDPSVADVSDEYMFGRDLLVAPVINDDAVRTNAFPAGVWTSLWDGKTITGPAQVKATVPLETIPVYLRQGAVVPVQLNPKLQFGQSMSGGRVSALVVTVPDGEQAVTMLNDHGEAATVTVSSASGVSKWKLENLPETHYLLVYGTADAATVKLNGKPLAKLGTTELDAMPVGWQPDPSSNRLVIQLPMEKGAREIEVSFKPDGK